MKLMRERIERAGCRAGSITSLSGCAAPLYVSELFYLTTKSGVPRQLLAGYQPTTACSMSAFLAHRMLIKE